MAARVDLLLINPPMALFPPDYPQKGMFVRFIQPAINPGILSIASYAAERGFDVRIVDYSEVGALSKAQDNEVSFDAQSLLRLLEETSPRAVGISNTSVFDYLECQLLFRLVKQWRPDVFCVGGGQNISMLGEIALHDIPELDAIVVGEGEYAVIELLQQLGAGKTVGGIPGVMTRSGCHYAPSRQTVDINTLPPPRFDLYPGYQSFIPYIEESRGCWARCNFCPNQAFYGAKARTKTPEILERDLANAVKHFGTRRIFALTTSIFDRANESAIDEFCSRFERYGVHWTTQTRCDVKIARFLPRLHAAGLFLLNMGLESGSPTILRNMGKTPNPEIYLELASEALDAVEAIGTLWTCCNIIFFPGESRKTMKETLNFLVRHQNALNAVVANPVFGFPGAAIWRDPGLVTRLGGVMFESDYCRKTHHFPVAPSHEFGLEEIGHFSETLEKVFTANPILDTELDYRDMEPSFFGGQVGSRTLSPDLPGRTNG